MVTEEIIEVIYFCDHCNREFQDEEDAEKHEAECKRNPKVIAEEKHQLELLLKKQLGLEPEDEDAIPKTLKMSKEMLAGNATLG